MVWDFSRYNVVVQQVEGVSDLLHDVAERLRPTVDLDGTGIAAISLGRSPGGRADTGLLMYPGGKSGAGVYQSIINQMPPHRVYLEPFLGGGGVMRRKRPALLNLGIDLDTRAVRTFVTDLRRGLELASPVRGMRDRGPVEVVRLGLPWLRSAAAFDSVGSAPGSWLFGAGDAISLLSDFRFVGDELVYCDPPYMLETRSGGRIYRHEMTDSQHLQLLSVLLGLRCSVMISGYRSRLYDQVLQGWRSFEFQTTNRAGRRVTETVWCNFPEPVALHDYRYLGRTFRERERLKRKRVRWVSRLRRMDVLSRRALLAALQEVEGP